MVVFRKTFANVLSELFQMLKLLTTKPVLKVTRNSFTSIFLELSLYFRLTFNFEHAYLTNLMFSMLTWNMYLPFSILTTYSEFL